MLIDDSLIVVNRVSIVYIVTVNWIGIGIGIVKMLLTSNWCDIIGTLRFDGMPWFLIVGVVCVNMLQKKNSTF